MADIKCWIWLVPRLAGNSRGVAWKPRESFSAGTTTKILALVAVSLLAMAAPQIIDSHIHLWTDDIAQYPRADGAPAIPNALLLPGTVEQMVAGMQAAGIKGALIVQVNCR